MEYTFLVLFAVLVTVVLDFLLKTHLLRRREFWLFMGVMAFFKVITNGYLTARPIVSYGEEFYFGVRLGTIPLEDFFYGFSLITTTVILWEYYTQRDTGAATPGEGIRVGNE
jgi:lycopene cyclase domain-containing protein